MNDHQYIHAGLSVPPVATALGTFLGYLPSIAAVVSILWIGVQAYFFFKDRKKAKK